MRIALAQINTTLGDLDGNRGLIIARLREAEAAGADLVCFPELSLCGYPPEDLLLKRDFLADCSSALRELAREVDDVAVVVGTPQFAEDVFNAAAVLYRGAVVAMYRKRFLPNYGVFDENRYFAPGEEGLVVNISASPYQRGKQETREKLVESRAVDATALVAYVSCVGGQDELVFDGGSMIVHPREGIIARAPRFEECVLVHDVDTSGLLSRRMTEPTHR